MEEQKRKIAIIKDRTIYDYHDDGYDTEKKIIDSITEWAEVSEADFALLRAASNRLGFSVIEQPRFQEIFIAKSIEDYKQLVASDDKKRKKEEADRLLKTLQRKQKKEIKTKAQKQALLEQLQKELGVK